MAMCYVLNCHVEAEVLEADAGSQVAKVQRPGQLFPMLINFRNIQNVALKYADGTIAQNFGAPRISNPASLEYLFNAQVMS